MRTDDQTLEILNEVVNKLKSSSPPGVIKVEASAGSGKTFLLTLVYITIALYGKLKNIPDINFSRILAITFTRDATGEMKNRILELLRELSVLYYMSYHNGPHIEENHIETKIETKDDRSLSDRTAASLKYLKEIFPEADEKDILSKARELYEEILEDYSSFSIQTIDSLLTGIALSLSSLTDSSSPSPENIVLQEENLFKEAIKRIVTKADMDKHIFNLLHSLVEIELKQSPEVEFNPMKLVEERLEQLFKDDLDRTSTLNIKIEELRKKIEEVENAILQEFGTTEGKATLDKILSEVMRSQIKVDTIPPSKSRIVPRFVHKVFEEVFRIKSIDDNPDPLSLLEKQHRRQIKTATTLTLLQAIKFSLSILELYKRVLEELNIIKRERRLVSLEDVKRTIYQVFHPETEIPDAEDVESLPLFYFLSEKYSFFLIDEFQDTDAGEWNALKELIKEVLSYQQPSLLLIVGDRKQAIYRWKGGRVELFDEVSRDLNSEEKTFILSSNYRSSPEILSSVSQVFHIKNILSLPFSNLKFSAKETSYPYIFPSFDEIYSPEKVEQRAQQRISGKIEIKTFPKDDENREEKILRELAEVARLEIENDYEVAVLVRRREDGEKIASFLSKEGIPHVISISPKLSESPSVSTVLNMITCALEGDSLYSLTLALMEPRGPFWKMNTEEKLKILRETTAKSEEDKTQFLKETLAQKDPDGLMLFEKIKNGTLRARNPYEAVSFIIDALPPLNDEEKSSTGHLKLLREISLRKNFISLPLRLFVEKLQEESQEEIYGAKAREGKGKVTIKTVHSAKGLEYDVVLIPFSQINLKSSGSGIQRFAVIDIGRFNRLYLDESKLSQMDENSIGKIAFEAQEELFELLGLQEEGKSILLPLNYKISMEVKETKNEGSKSITINTADFSPLLSMLRYRDYFFRELENLNLLYVAMTRARKKIYLWIPEEAEEPSSSAPWWALLKTLQKSPR